VAARTTDPWSRYVRGVRRTIGNLRRVKGLGGPAWLGGSRTLLRWAIISVPIGLVAGFGAVAFFSLWLFLTESLLGVVVGIRYPLAGLPPGGVVLWGSSFPRILLLPLVAGLGGLGAGVLGQRFAPEILGHGTDEAIVAFHRRSGKIRARVPFLKMVASALTLGSGGAGGREGPVAQVGAGFGSVWATTLRLTPRERRIALATGLGAGVGAIFKAPLGGALYATEIFYLSDFEPDVFVPAVMASVTSYAVYGLFFGFSTLFASPLGVGFSIDQLPLYALLGILCAGAGVAFVKMYARIQRWFSGRSWPVFGRVALGGAASGATVLVAYFLVPQSGHLVALASVDVGYGFVQAVMLQQTGLESLGLLAVAILLLAVVVRMVATSFTVGSGGAAGLFGTSVVIGAFLGSSVGYLFRFFFPQEVPFAAISGFAIVGMMAFFGGISKAPLAVLVMVVEMAGSYSLLLPAMLAIFIAYAATGGNHLYSAQLPSRLYSPAHQEEYRDLILQQMPLADLPREAEIQLPPSTPVAHALEAMARTGKTTLPVVEEGQLVGVVHLLRLTSLPEIVRSQVPVMEVVDPCLAIVSSEASAAEALAVMDRVQTSEAAIVSAEPPVRFIGLVSRGGILHLLPTENSSPGEAEGEAPRSTGGDPSPSAPRTFK
jgi:CIC family chloride channel protein